MERRCYITILCRARRESANNFGLLQSSSQKDPKYDTAIIISITLIHTAKTRIRYRLKKRGIKLITRFILMCVIDNTCKIYQQDQNQKDAL